MVATVKEQGLEGVVAVHSDISTIIEDKSLLVYRGYSIEELAENATFEDVIYLLWEGTLPTQAELDELRRDLAANSALPAAVLAMLKTTPQNALPMDVLRTAVSLLGLYDPDARDNSEAANKRKAVRLTAQLPTIITSAYRIAQGKEPIAPLPEATIAENFLYMLTGERPAPLEIRAFDTALVLHADHELNASTFSARVTAATLSDLHSAITSAIGTLKGPLHGGANQAVMQMLEEIGDDQSVDDWVRDRVARKVLIMGFGHRVYKHGDPRAKYLRDLSKELGERNGELKWYTMSLHIDRLVQELKGLLPNVDFYSASTYHSLGIPTELFTPIFAASRITGWIAHVLEQYKNNRLIRPRAEYIGETELRYVPISERR